MSLDYKLSIENIKDRLAVAHDSGQAIIRGKFFESEYGFFKKEINGKKVLVAGSGLGDDSFELVKYNEQVVGVELLEQLVEYSKQKSKELGLNNVIFQCGDIKELPFRDEEFDAVVLNMGTIGNFDNKEVVLKELLRVASKVYFDFYPPTKEGLETRRKMYTEELWKNVRIQGNKIISDDGLESGSISKNEIDTIVKSLGAKVRYHDFHEFSIMAEVYE